MILAGHTNSYNANSLARALDGIARAGYTHAELSAIPNRDGSIRADDPPETVRRELERAGLDCVAMSVPLEPADERSVSEARALIEWGGRFGLAHINCGLGNAPVSGDGWITALAGLGDAAEAAGLSLNIEVHGPLAPTGLKTAALLSRLDHQAIGMNYDTGNVEFYGAVAATEDLPHVLDAVEHVHLKDKLGGQGDWAFPALGGGHVDFQALADVLKRKPEVPLSVEIEFHGDPWPDAAVVDDAMATSRSHLQAVGLA